MADLKTVLRPLAVAATLIAVTPALPHHSFAMFDMGKKSR
jgi:hypothetical protein